MKEIELLNRLHIQQVWEALEAFTGIETRNRYRILDDRLMPVAFAAERKTGLGGTIMRQLVGHWRSFKVDVFNEASIQVLELHFPFRWFLKTLIVKAHGRGHIGKLQQRFSLLHKKFDVHDHTGRLIAEIKSPLWKMWTFEMRDKQKKWGSINKKWSGALGELFTDKDNFVVDFDDPNLSPNNKALMLATCLMIDIVYFENNHKSRRGLFR